MTLKGINSGVEKLAGERITSIEKQLNQHEKAWRDLRNKLDSLLIGTNVIKGDVVRKQCQDLNLMNTENRYNHIISQWGIQYAEKARPLLHQLEILEREMAKLKIINQ